MSNRLSRRASRRVLTASISTLTIFSACSGTPGEDPTTAAEEGGTRARPPSDAATIERGGAAGAGNAPDAAGVGDAREAVPGVTDDSGITLDGRAPDPPADDSGTCTRWDRRILKGDCSIDWDKWQKVASSYDQTDVLDYKYGPTWTVLHPDDPQGASLPMLWGAPDRGITDGWYKWHTTLSAADIYDKGGPLWYSNSGQLLYAPEQANDAGLALARSFATYASGLQGNFWRAYDLRVSWEGAGGDWYLKNPDYSVERAPVLAANRGMKPTRPIATARANVQRGMIAPIVYENGLVTAARNDAQVTQYNAATRLGPNKVPTAIAVTPGNEFVLITVWDTQAKKGQLAVVAVQGELCGTADGHDSKQPGGRQSEVGLPNWFMMESLKVIGYVDLPIAAPMSVATSSDQTWKADARDGNNQVVTSLSNAAERAKWANTVDGLHTAPKAGYAIVSSRAEDQVVFVDLQPLYQYYRSMYFTTQSKYQETQNKGSAAGQWPYTFEHEPSQIPVVASVLKVAEPTVVAAGIELTLFSTDKNFRTRAFVGTMGGQLLTYDVTGLNDDSVAAPPALEHSEPIGRNPTSITFGGSEWPGDVVWVTSRGDRAVYRVKSDGTVINKLQDRRMQDPVYAFSGQGYGLHNLSVSDFNGRQVLSYLTSDLTNSLFTSDIFFVVGNGKSPFEFAAATAVPGKPIQFTFAEVF